MLCQMNVSPNLLSLNCQSTGIPCPTGTVTITAMNKLQDYNNGAPAERKLIQLRGSLSLSLAGGYGE